MLSAELALYDRVFCSEQMLKSWTHVIWSAFLCISFDQSLKGETCSPAAAQLSFDQPFVHPEKPEMATENKQDNLDGTRILHPS